MVSTQVVPAAERTREGSTLGLPLAVVVEVEECLVLLLVVVVGMEWDGVVVEGGGDEAVVGCGVLVAGGG